MMMSPMCRMACCHNTTPVRRPPPDETNQARSLARTVSTCTGIVHDGWHMRSCIHLCRPYWSASSFNSRTTLRTCKPRSARLDNHVCAEMGSCSVHLRRHDVDNSRRIWHLHLFLKEIPLAMFILLQRAQGPQLAAAKLYFVDFFASQLPL